MDVKVNINNTVKVKLTDYGISILKKQHDDLNKMILSNGGMGVGEFELRLDGDGYYSTQLWTLMNRFGHVMRMSDELPFYIDIIIEGGEPIND